ncbi:unnamed protein product [Durusdinium trenchii]|uniref:Uncharacterized protein n=1 Tax=Durusdinium trenchii TaxID=1381693 RepID=A0ABP0J5B4_9DINO
MDADMDELMDLLAYECPYTGKKRIPGCYESVDQQSSTKKIKIGSTPDNYDKVDLQTSPDGYDETMFSEYFNRGLSGEPCEPPPAHVNCANCPEHLQRTINAENRDNLRKLGDNFDACCKHVVQIAKHEVDNNPASSQAMREFACIREEDAEAAAAKAINIAVTFMYKSGLWLQSTSARRLSDWIFSFLGHYSLLAQLTLNAGKARYPMYPKNHMLCHAAVDLARRAERCEWQLSPLSTACQQEEDFIGKPSKISRFTNIRQAHRSVIWRSMIKIQYSLQQAGNDQRGMDSYADL